MNNQSFIIHTTEIKMTALGIQTEPLGHNHIMLCSLLVRVECLPRAEDMTAANQKCRHVFTMSSFYLFGVICLPAAHIFIRVHHITLCQ